MAIVFHPNAAANSDERAVDLKSRLKEVEAHAPIGSFYQPRVRPVASFGEADIQDLRHIGTFSPLTNELIELTFEHNRKHFVLDQAGCEDAHSLAKKVWIYQRKRLSRERIFEELRRWLDPATNDDRAFTKRLVDEISPTLKLETHLVPISGLHVQSPIVIGDVTFRDLSNSEIDGWLVQAQTVLGEAHAEKVVAEFFNALGLKHAGHAIAEISIESTPGYGAIAAFDIVTDAVALLRLFDPSNFDVRACSLVKTFGEYAIPAIEVWTLQEESRVPTFMQRIKGSLPAAWEIGDDQIRAIKAEGLDSLSAIFASENPTEFQSLLLNALLIYSRVPLSEQQEDKLFYMLVALEMLLLKSDTESIQSAIGDRLAFLMCRSIDDRIHVVKLVQKVYEIRSKWVHHGEQPIGKTKLLNEFVRLAWDFLIALVRNHDKFVTHADFISHIEKIKYS